MAEFLLGMIIGAVLMMIYIGACDMQREEDERSEREYQRRKGGGGGI